MHRVYVVEGIAQIGNIFFERPEFRLTSKLKEANIVVFPGGPDVNPELYGTKKHPKTYFDQERDRNFLAVYNLVKSPSVLKIGICGGGQFLHVMAGGLMWQDVDRHAGSLHDLIYSPVHLLNETNPAGTKYEVTSTHHQMMMPNTGEVWGVADNSTYRDQSLLLRMPRGKEEHDIEIVYHDKPNNLCFQPHPEYGHKSTEEVFFKCVYTAIKKSGLKS